MCLHTCECLRSLEVSSGCPPLLFSPCSVGKAAAGAYLSSLKSPCLTSQVLGLQGCAPMSRFLHRCWGSQLRSSCLCGKGFASLAISQAPYCKFSNIKPRLANSNVLKGQSCELCWKGFSYKSIKRLYINLVLQCASGQTIQVLWPCKESPTFVPDGRLMAAYCILAQKSVCHLEVSSRVTLLFSSYLCLHSLENS